jgi:23S rRNA (cytidine1920-2'-O)/16S rRNA (cytidine1409-2'-O)-methyltransferase
MPARVRLDTLLADRGLFASRSRAAASVMAGEVRVGDPSRVAAKPGELVRDDVAVDLAERPRYVSRGGIKLSNAMQASGLDVSGRLALDVGASHGGFSDCLLQAGAAQVTCVDVGYGLLDLRLREDPRVTVIDRRNARSLTPQELPYRAEVIVVDVSFIGLAKVLGAVLDCASERFDMLALVKPQFEVGRARIGSGGVVRDPADRRAALCGVGEAARILGATVLGYYSSGLPGPKGNQESFIWLAEAGRPGAREDIEAAASEVEP